MPENTQTFPNPLTEVSPHIEEASHIREELYRLIEYVDGVLSRQAHPSDERAAGREVSLVKTKLQEARMWAGMIKSHYDTGFVDSDKPE